MRHVDEAQNETGLGNLRDRSLDGRWRGGRLLLVSLEIFLHPMSAGPAVSFDPRRRRRSPLTVERPHGTARAPSEKYSASFFQNCQVGSFRFLNFVDPHKRHTNVFRSSSCFARDARVGRIDALTGVDDRVPKNPDLAAEETRHASTVPPIQSRTPPRDVGKISFVFSALGPSAGAREKVCQAGARSLALLDLFGTAA